MKKEDLDAFKTAINGLYLATSNKTLDEAAMGFWILALKEFDYAEVREALTQWAKEQKFAPKPAEIVNLVKVNRAIAREQVEAKNRVHTGEDDMPEVYKMAYMQRIIAMHPTYEGRAQALKKLEEAGEEIMPCHQWWWRRVLGEE